MVLSVLHEKLAEAHGLAIAASTVSAKLEDRTDELELIRELGRMRHEAHELRERCLALERELGEEAATEMLAHANTTDETASDLAGAWFKAGTDPIRSWWFLVMGEAAEVAAWSVVRDLAHAARAVEIEQLAGWALPIQERHLAAAFDCLRILTARTAPLAARWG